MSLSLHDLLARPAQLHSRIGVNAIVNTAMIWDITACHSAISSIHNGITAQCRDIALPEAQASLSYLLFHREFRRIHRSLLLTSLLQIGILHFQYLCRNSFGQANIHQASQELSLFFFPGRQFQATILRIFL